MSNVVYKRILCKSIEKEVNSLQKQILDLVELAIPKDKWETARSKVLRLTNDLRRTICSDLEENYKVERLEDREYDEVIEVRMQERK